MYRSLAAKRDEARDQLYRAFFDLPGRQQSRRAIRALIDAYPDPLTIDDVKAAVYPGNSARYRAEPTVSVRIIICRLRRDLEPYGWTITNSKPPGRPTVNSAPHRAQYRLTKLPTTTKELPK